ncbi:MAG: hypothetical protein ACFCD0_20415 [Gemmataceae bacterium]
MAQKNNDSENEFSDQGFAEEALSDEEYFGEDDEQQVPDGAALFPLIPEELGVHPLLLSSLQAVVFLVGSTERVVEPSASEEVLQYMLTYFQRLEGSQLTRIQEDVQTLFGFAKQEGWTKQEVRFLKEILSHFGPEKT